MILSDSLTFMTFGLENTSLATAAMC